MDLQLTGKRALVCGGSSGLGRAVAEALAAEGAHIDVPRGAILEDTIVTGALRLLAH